MATLSYFKTQLQISLRTTEDCHDKPSIGAALVLILNDHNPNRRQKLYLLSWFSRYYSMPAVWTLKYSLNKPETKKHILQF
jgi:hypothetical protein